MANGGRIEYSVGFKADSTSLNNIKNSLKEIKDISLEALNPRAADYSNHEQAFINLQESASKLEAALDKAFNKDLGTLNIAKFNKELQKLDLHKIEKDMQAAGAAGVTAFRNIAAQALTTNMQLKQTNTFIDKIATTLSNTIKWNLASGAVNSFTGKVQQAYGYVKNLDGSLNDIRIVTGKSAEEMERFAKIANQAAQDLGKGTTDYTNAALIYYQQGLDEAEVQARADITLKTANVTGQSASDVSEQLTAVWNGYKVSAEEAELYIDKIAAVAADTAADLEELSTGMSKVASAASLMGVDIDQLNSQLATIVSVTRQAPESVGTALKTIYARMGDIEAGLDEETTLGEYTQAMADMGFNVLDMNGSLRDMGEVIEEIGGKWTTLSREQQISLAQTAAGTRQYNNLLALFDNWDMYTKAMETSANAAGTLQKQQDIYMESTAAHIEQLEAKWEDFYDSILDNKTINTAVDLIGDLVNGLTNVVDGLGGGIQTFELLGTVATSILSKKIASGISTFIKNINNAKNNVEQFKAQIATVEMFKGTNDDAVIQMTRMREEAIKYASFMDVERQNEATAHIQTINQLYQQQEEWNELTKEAQEYYDRITGNNSIAIDFGLKNEDNQNDRDYIISINNNLKEWKETINLTRLESNKLFKSFSLDNFSGIEDSINQLESFSDRLVDNQLYLGQYSDELGESLDEWHRYVESLQNSNIDIDFADPEAIERVQALRSAVIKIIPELEADAKRFEGTIDKSFNGAKEDIEDAISSANSSWTNFTKVLQTEAGINAVINLANNLNQMVQIFQTIKNIGNIWSDETLSETEKLEQTIGSIVGLLPVFISLIISSKNTIISLAGAIGGAEVATLGFGNALKYLLLQTPVGWILGVVTAITALITIYDSLTISAKEAEEALKESRKVFDESQEELKNLESELSNVQARLKELLALENKEFTDLEEIKKLQKEEALLKSQLAIQKELNEEKQKDLEEKITQNRESGNYDVQKWDSNKVQKEFASSVFKSQYETAFNNRVDMNASEETKNAVSQRVSAFDKMQDLVNDIYQLSYEDYGTDKYDNLLIRAANLSTEITSIDDENVQKLAQEAFDEWITKTLEDFDTDRINYIQTFDTTQLLKDLKDTENLENKEAIQNLLASYWRSSNVAGTNVQNAFQNSGFTQERVDEIITGSGPILSPEEVDKLNEYAELYGITVDDLIEDAKTYGVVITETIEEQGNGLSVLQQKIEDIKESLTNLTGIIDSLKSGKELTEEQIAELEKLENEYEFLDNIINKNSDDYINALNQIQEIEEAKLIALEEEQANQLKITAEINVSEMTSALEEFLDADYETTVAIKADIDSDFERAIDILETSKDLASKIGDNFIVSANDLSELGAAFPGILDNIKYLENGTIKLSQQSVEIAKNAAKAKIKESNDTAIAHIKDQIIILENEKATIQQQLDIIKNADNTEIDLEKKTQTIKQAVERASVDLSAKNADILAGIESERLSDSLIATSTSQDQFYKNHVLTLENADKAMADWADNTRKYIDYGYKLTDIKPVAFTSSSANVTKTTKVLDKDTLLEAQNYYNRHDINDGEDAQTLIDRYLQERYYDQGLLSEKDIDEIILQLESAIESRDYLINLGKAQIEEIKASQHETFKSWDNIAQGLGLDGAREAEILELLDEEYDRYHDINIEIQKITNSMSKLEKQQDKLLGQDLIQNLEDQLDLLEKQKAAQEIKLIMAKQEQEELKGQLAENYGAAFDGDTISNYKALYTQQLNKIVEMQKAYNNMSKDEQEEYEKQIEAEEKKFDKFKELLERYETLSYETIADIEEEIQDSIDKIVEYQVEMFTFDINFKIDSTEFAKEFNDFKKRFIDQIEEDDILGNALANIKDYGLYYDRGGNGIIQGLTNQIMGTIDQIKQIEETGTSSIYGNDRAKAIEDMKTYYEELMKQLEDVQSLVDEINQSYLDMMDEAKTKFEEQVSMYEYIADLVDSDMNIVKLLYGEDSFEEFERFYNVMENNNNKNLDFQRQQIEFWRNQMNMAEEGSDAWKAAKQNWLDSVTSFNSALEASIETLIERYENTVNKIFSDLGNRLTGGKGLDYISEEWELMGENADQYLDTVNAAFELRQLERKWVDTINESSLVAQGELNHLMNEQMKMLREKDKLTQYDVDRANALYDIAVKEIALKEAQQNKSKMRLRRDAQGNYTYQYVSDEDAVVQAQQELDEARNSLYNMDKDAYKENLDAVYKYYVDFENAMKELYADASLTEEEREKRKLLLVEHYNELINGVLTENNIIRNNLQDSAEQAMIDSLGSFMMNDLIPQWNSGLQEMADKFAADGGLVDACQGALVELDTATQEYQDSLDRLEASAGVNFDELASGYNENIPLVQQLVQDNGELISSYEAQLEAIQDVIDEVETLVSAYQEAERAALAATQAAYKYWQEQNKDTAANARPANNGGSTGSGSESSGSSSSGSGSSEGSGKSAGDGIASVGDVVTFAHGIYYAASDGTGDTGSQSLGEQVTITKTHPGAAYPIHIANSKYALGWVRKDQITGFDTGGYTGNWAGSAGKLGVFHKKELVLNQQDTANILTAVSIARTMNNVLDSIAGAVRGRMFNLSSGFNSASSFGGLSNGIQQNVTIHADFPNATDHSEIEQAFNNLLNTASQYAFRNGRG